MLFLCLVWQQIIWIILRRLLLMNKKFECKGQKVFSKMLRKICKKVACKVLVFLVLLVKVLVFLWLCLLWLYWGLWVITLVVFENVLVFYFPLSQFPTIVSSSFFLKEVISLVIPEELLHFRCRNLWVVGLPLSKYLQIYCNSLLYCSFSDDLGQWCKVYSLSTHLSNFLEPFHIACRSHS